MNGIEVVKSIISEASPVYVIDSPAFSKFVENGDRWISFKALTMSIQAQFIWLSAFVGLWIAVEEIVWFLILSTNEYWKKKNIHDQVSNE